MTRSAENRSAAGLSQPPRMSLWRLWPLALLVLAGVFVVGMGWHRLLTLETLVRYRMELADFVTAHAGTAVSIYIALYIAVVALSLPGASIFTVIGGALFGTLIGGCATVVGATIGAVIIFLIAKSALGEYLMRRAGPLIAKLADGFRQDAFSYMLFLRLIPAFPFWLINLASAFLGVKLTTFAASTALGIVPGTFTLSFIGADLDSVLLVQEERYRACLAAGSANCAIEFNLMAALTPQLLAGFAALGLVVLIPVAVKKWRARKAGP